jgi:hypothetical protein
MNPLALADELEALLKAVKPAQAQEAAPSRETEAEEAALGDPEDAPVLMYLQGADGVPVPADWHPASRRLRVRHEDLAGPQGLKKALDGFPVGAFAREVLAGTQDLWLPFVKGISADAVAMFPDVPRSTAYSRYKKLLAAGALTPQAAAVPEAPSAPAAPAEAAPWPTTPAEIKARLAADYGFQSAKGQDEWFTSEKGKQAVAEVRQTLDLLSSLLGIPTQHLTMGLPVHLSFWGKPDSKWSGSFSKVGSTFALTINPAQFGKGGPATLVHEYGHLLDYAGGYRAGDPGHCLSNVWKATEEPAEDPARSMWRITRLFAEPGHGSEKSYLQYSQHLDQKHGMPGYFGTSAEMFARAFERHISRQVEDLPEAQPFHAELYDGLTTYTKPRPQLSAALAPHFGTLLAGLKATPLKKNIDTTGTLPAGAKFSAEDLKAMKLKWITAHPNGPGTDPAVPLIVHDNGDHYVVVGGAGGKLNQTVLQKGGEKKKLKAAAKQKSTEQQEQFQRNDPEAFQKLQTAAKVYKDAAKEALADHVHAALEKLGGSLPELQAEAKKQAEAQAKEQDPNATPEEVEKFVSQAVKAAEGEAKKAVEGAMQKALDAVAKAEINQEAVTAQDLEITVGGKKLVKQLSPDELQDLIQSAANVDAIKAAEAGIRKALKTGKTDHLPGLDALLEHTAPSEAEVAQWVKDGFLQRKSIKDNVALVEESSLASKGAQQAHQAAGAADALNAYSSMVTGSAILSPDLVQYLGVEGAARVLAAHLTQSGHDAGQLADKLGEKIGARSDLHVAASLQAAGEMDALAQAAVDAAEKGDGTVTWSQALIVRENQAARKFALLNCTRGHLQAASSLYWHLSHGNQKPLVLKGGANEIATRARAKSLGLAPEDYELQGAEGGHQLAVKPEAVHKLASPASPAQADRARQLAEIKAAAEAAGHGGWQPQQDWNDGSGAPGPDGKVWKIDLAPHQAAAARAIVELGGLVGNLGAGSGKTFVMHAAASELLHTGKAKRGLITMPPKPRAQQEGKGGELDKCLSGATRERFLVVKSGAHLDQVLKENPDRVLIMSPELMRDRADLLQAHGFGGPDSFTFCDEAQDLVTGSTEGEGSGKAQAARKLVAGSGYKFLGSGTLMAQDASEVYDALGMVAPQDFPKGGQKAFQERWERQAGQGQSAVLAGEALGALNAEVGGYMLHFHQAPEHNGKPVSLEQKKVVLPLSAEAQAAVVAANEQRAKDETHADPNVRAASALKWSGAVQRACIGPAMFDHISDYVGDRRKADPSYKAVVWSQELGPIEELKGRLGKHGKVVTITGANNDAETKKAIDAFQNDPDVVGIVVSNAANFGVNLQAGHSLIKCGFPPVPSKDEQLDARIFRRGQEKDVETITYMADHPLVRQAYETLHNVKGKSLELLQHLADDHLLGQVLAEYAPASTAGTLTPADLKAGKQSGVQAGPATVTMSRRKDSAPQGQIGAGTFHSLYAHQGNGPEAAKWQAGEHQFTNLLHLPQSAVEAGDPAYPAYSAHQHFFPGKPVPTDSKQLEQAVAGEARKRGHDGIRYGDYEVQDLREPQALAKSLAAQLEAWL